MKWNSTKLLTNELATLTGTKRSYQSAWLKSLMNETFSGFSGFADKGGSI